MSEAEPVSDPDRAHGHPVFVSYATSDRKQALAFCKAIESRGTNCWISTRDVAPGENYQEAIVRAIRDARALVLIFSSAANNSDEIKKELSLASRYRIPVMALRTEDVEPSDAFAYELSTRQWIDAFEGRDKAIDQLVAQLRQVAGDAPAARAAAAPARRTARLPKRPAAIAAGLAVLLLVSVATWFLLRTPASAAHSMTVRLAGFQLLSAGLPPALTEAVDSEIAAAFNADGVVGVSTASAPAPGKGPAYALSGTIQREGSEIRVITRLTNERSGATLWSDTFNYDGKEADRVPRHVAVDAGNVVRCGLFGASTYRKTLPDDVLKDYMQFCQGHWAISMREGRKALLPAQRVVAAVPDFSWGWAAVAGGYWKVAMTADNDRLADQARASGREAADRAVEIDPRNSEALFIKALLLEPRDWTGREALLKRAVEARRLDCGCEHHQYGWMLQSVGRTAEALEQFRMADEMLSLYVWTSLSLADALVAAGKLDESKPHFDAAVDLAPNQGLSDYIRSLKAARTGDVDALMDPRLQIPTGWRAAVVKAVRAQASRSGADKTQAIRALLALPEDEQDDMVAMLLGSLGASHQAFELANRLSSDGSVGPAMFWFPSMRSALNDPGFPATAKRLGLMDYWKASGTRPDVCSEKAPPPFCRMI